MLVRKKCRTALLILLMMGWNCHENSSEFVREASVDAILTTGPAPQIIQIYYSTDKIDEAVDRETLFVRDAQVFVKNAAQEIRFHYFVQRDTAFFDGSVFEMQWFVDAPDSLRVVPGETFELLVETDAGVITGETTVPGDFEMFQPAETSDFFTEQALNVSWSASAGAAWYRVGVVRPPEEIVVSPDTSVFRRWTQYYETSETQTIIPEHVFFHAGTYDIFVEAFDENFRRFAVDGFDRGGVTGGYGLFGSKNVVKRVIEVRDGPPDLR